ncbi:hypothetical protein PIB30_054318, partial [Stylosanthes scabra]|nr:hypothetical protein [Stylosanthes scabra]
VVKDGNARKIALKTETDNQLMKPLHYDLKHSPTEDLVVNNIMQVNKNSDEKESGEEEDNDDNHHKHQEKVDSDSDSDDEEEEEDDHGHDHDDDHKKKGKQESKKEHKGEHKKLIKDPELNVFFFTPKDLYVGKTMRAYFAKKNSSTCPKFLPREEAEQIPFSSSSPSQNTHHRPRP